MRPDRAGIDSRTWLLWGAAVSVPLITGRHPVLIVELLLIVLAVRTVCLPPSRRMGWGWLVRLGAIAVPIGVVFNMFTVHAGDRDLFRVPSDVPIIGGTVTLNAVVYGLLSGLTVVALVATGTTVAAAIDWSALMRLVPARAAAIAVAGSVAWAFLPQLSTSWREIREAQAARGHRWRGVRDALPLIVPLMAGGLDRSVTMAEALESRGFGAVAPMRQASPWPAVAIGGALTTAVAGLYLFAVGRSVEAAASIVGAGVLSLVGAKGGAASSDTRTTRYRETSWARIDWTVAAGALAALVATTVTLQ
ncbi:MAG TPA: energy-coupling factor transporter transmembrane component T, partial [Thermomicrobiales bacterium]|nr:energy-coupling factor transporter transmembrane component T [Thermomicrobiales bacterium]